MPPFCASCVAPAAKVSETGFAIQKWMIISAEPIIAKFLLGTIPRLELPLHANASSDVPLKTLRELESAAITKAAWRRLRVASVFESGGSRLARQNASNLTSRDRF